MSFGFSVGDFVVLRDKAFLIYDRCKDAPGEYADLTAHVQQLRDVLDDMKTFLVEAERQGHIPQSQSQLASLKARHNCCNITLDEVDEFLDKYMKVEAEKGGRRIISLAKFIISDAKLLSKKLEGEASSLQLRLSSLTSLSVLNVRDALTNIAKDYRTLEDSNIHPDSISLNMPSPLEAVKSAHKENVPSGDRDPYADQATTWPDDSITMINGEIALDEARSRANSTASSASKPDNWHPYDRPAPEYVQDKLWPLFHDEIASDPFSAKAKHAIVRAFHQVDYSDGGFLFRSTVLSHLINALGDVSVTTPSEDLEDIVLQFDVHQAGYFDKNDFRRLIQELMKRASELGWADAIRQAKIDWADRSAAAPFPFLQWGFSESPEPGEYYVDNLRNVLVHEIPRVTSLSAFSTMAWEANLCVKKISDFEAEWIGIVPKALQGEYGDPLRKVQQIATAFTLLENPSSRLMLSDLDTFLSCARIVSYLDNRADTLEVDRTSYHLEVAKRHCVKILDCVLGFTFTLRKTQTFQNIEARALRLVKDYHKHEPERAEKRKAELIATPWEGHISAVSVLGSSCRLVGHKWDTRRRYAKISITDSAQVLAAQEFTTIPQKRALRQEWSLSTEFSM